MTTLLRMWRQTSCLLSWLPGLHCRAKASTRGKTQPHLDPWARPSPPRRRPCVHLASMMTTASMPTCSLLRMRPAGLDQTSCYGAAATALDCQDLLVTDWGSSECNWPPMQVASLLPRVCLRQVLGWTALCSDQT